MAEPFPPLVDLHGPDAPERLDAACREVGFFQIVGHDIPEATLTGLHAAADAFFGQPLEEKLRWTSGVPEIERGYSAKGTEGLSYSLGLDNPPDLFEAFTLGLEPLPDDPAYHTDAHTFFAPNIWPDQPVELRSALLDYYGHVDRLVHRVTSLLAVALGMPADFFEAHTDRSTDTLRINWFEGSEPVLPGQFGIGPHTDYGIVSILFADQAPGLQVYTQDEEWRSVVPEPGALLVNVGDMLSRWTNDRWRSTLHRVWPVQATDGEVTRRRSVPFFHEGNFDAVVECLPTCSGPGNPAKYPPITIGQHVFEKMLSGRLLEAADATSTVGERTAALSE